MIPRMKSSIRADQLVKTSKACELIGVSRRTLHRWISEGILEEDQHFWRGLTSKSPHRWDVKSVEVRIRALRALPAKPSTEVQA